MDQGSARRGAGTRGAGTALSGTEFAGIGLQFALTIAVFSFAGVWLDRRLGTSPWLLLICVFVGAAGGFFSMFRKITAAQRRDAERIARAKQSQQAQQAQQAQPNQSTHAPDERSPGE
jgi:F0F1-type ATP synthase assembly protein I